MVINNHDPFLKNSGLKAGYFFGGVAWHWGEGLAKVWGEASQPGILVTG